MAVYGLIKRAEFDIDDEEDERLYNKIKDDPRTDQWIQGTHDDLVKSRNLLGLGALASGAGAYAVHDLGMRKLRPVVAGLGGLGAYLGYKSIRKNMDLGGYDRGDYSDRRRQNIDRYMRNHGSEYAGRRAQKEADAQRRADFLNNLMLAHALRNRQD